MTARHRGFSLVELLAVVAILGLSAGAIVATLSRQQQFYRGATEVRSAREGVRDATELLSSDIRGMSAAETPFRADSALELLAAIGVSVACQVVGNEIGLPPAHVSGNTLSSFLTDPDTGDIAMFYTDSAAVEGRWRQYRIAAFESRNAASVCPQTSDFANGAEPSASQGFALVLAGMPSDIRAGTAVRFFRRGRYSLYRASDGKSYLGYRRCNALGPSLCGSIQPVSGPYRAYSADPLATGLLFEYFDHAGVRVDASAPASTLARIDITARVESSQRYSFSQRRANISDSATVSVALRNRGGD